MIEKVYEDRFGTVHYTGLAKDLEIIKTNPKYLYDKANGSKFYNIENPSNSLIWDKENKKWLDYDYNDGNDGDSKITTVEVVDGVLQLTKDKYQIAEVPSGTEIRMPEGVRVDEYTNINLIVNAKEDKFFVFDDIKWKEKPSLKNGYDYVISFTCINNIWYGEWLEYKEFEKTWLYKNGDEYTAVTGAWSFGNGWGSPCGLKGEECIYLNKDRVSSGVGVHDYCYTNKKINFSNYTKLYIDAKTSGMKVGDSITSNGIANVWVGGLSSSDARKIFEIDVSEKNDEYIFLIQCNNYDWVEIYKIWLE